ncbi:hypothetical protein P3S68_003270 [Capsicum galapagoense]
MRGGVSESFKFDLLAVFILLLCFRDSSCRSMNHPKGSLIEDIKDATLSLETSPLASPQPLLPLLAPSPLAPFTNSTSPKLSVYVSHLQRQSFVTNLQALDCAASLQLKLQKGNVSKNVYDLCRISLKDFSVQVATEVSGCLLPSLPSDAILDKILGIGFVCDLNDNIPAPWPSMSHSPASSCKKSVRIPALPVVASGQIMFQRIEYMVTPAAGSLDDITTPLYIECCHSWLLAIVCGSDEAFILTR